MNLANYYMLPVITPFAFFGESKDRDPCTKFSSLNLNFYMASAASRLARRFSRSLERAYFFLPSTRKTELSSDAFQ